MKKVPLVNPYYEAARNYKKCGRPSEAFIDACDYAWGTTLCQRGKTHGTPRRMQVASHVSLVRQNVIG